LPKASVPFADGVFPSSGGAPQDRTLKWTGQDVVVAGPRASRHRPRKVVEIAMKREEEI
jgi:hypothetical protein